MSELIEKIAYCIEFGKINLASPYPPNMKGEVGADELTKQAIDEGIDPDAHSATYRLVEIEHRGKRHVHGDFDVNIDLLAILHKIPIVPQNHFYPIFFS